MTKLTVEDLHQCDVTVYMTNKVSLDGVLYFHDGACSLVFLGGVYRFHAYQVASIISLDGDRPTISLVSRAEFYFDDQYLSGLTGQLVEIILRGESAEDFTTFKLVGTFSKSADGFYRIVHKSSGAIKFQLVDVAQVQTAGEYPQIYLRSNFL